MKWYKRWSYEKRNGKHHLCILWTDALTKIKSLYGINDSNLKISPAPLAWISEACAWLIRVFFSVFPIYFDFFLINSFLKTKLRSDLFQGLTTDRALVFIQRTKIQLFTFLKHSERTLYKIVQIFNTFISQVNKLV